MKKIMFILLGILSIGAFMFPNNVKAEVKITNFEETIKEEIELFDNAEGYEEYVSQLKKADLSNYKESDDKINIYIFRGSTCSYCLKAITYFSSIVDEYGKYFNLITYEVWGNQDNATLMNQVASAFNETADGVPYIIIGDKTFAGYSERMNSEIESQIKKVYNSKDKFDIMNNLDVKVEEDKKDTTNTKGNNSNTALLWIVQIVSIIAIVIYINIKNKRLKEETDEKIEGIKNELSKVKKPKK